LPGFLFYKLSN